MTVINMTRITFTEGGSFGIYHNTLSIETNSDAYLLPSYEVYAIGAYIGGDGEIEFTIDPPSNIEADTAIWDAWDGFSPINPAVTAFRVVRNSGTVVAKVTAKTKGA